MYKLTKIHIISINMIYLTGKILTTTLGLSNILSSLNKAFLVSCGILHNLLLVKCLVIFVVFLWVYSCPQYLQW